MAFIKGRQSEYMLSSKKQYTILEIAKMFKTKIKFLPSRKGERFGSSIANNNAFNHLGYKPKYKINTYISNFIKKK